MTPQRPLSQALYTDPLWELDAALRESKSFSTFIDSLPAIIESIQGEQLTFSTLVQGQFLCADYVARNGSTTICHLRDMLKGYANPQSTIARLGQEQQRFYCLTTPGGMTEEDFRDMEAGRLTVHDLLCRRPGAFLAPLLRKFDSPTLPPRFVS